MELKIELNCLCLFAASTTENKLHVLMPVVGEQIRSDAPLAAPVWLTSFRSASGAQSPTAADGVTYWIVSHTGVPTPER